MTLPEALQYGLKVHQSGNLAEARNIYQQILAQQPNQPDALHLLGVVAHQAGQSAAGAELIQKAIALNPGIPDYYINLGVILVAIGRLEEAVAAQRQALAFVPDHANAFNNLGYTLHEMGKVQEAITAGLQAIAIDPAQASAHNNLGTSYLSDNQIERAIACFRYAIELQPQFSDPYNNLGKALYTIGEVDEAIVHIERAIGLRFNYPEAHNNLGNALCAREEFDKAIACCRQSLALRPDYPVGHWNLGLILLLQGDFEGGWPEYEWRFRVKALGHRFNIPRPWWTGEDLAGKRILIHAEQGLGDTLQFIRYLPRIAERGGEVILAAQDELLPLLKDFPGVKELVDSTYSQVNFDVHCALVSLPRVFKTTLQNIPAGEAYLRVNGERADKWRDRLQADKRKIGLVWAGRPEHTNDRNRSFPLATFAPLAALPGIQFISLQKGGDTKNAPFAIADWTDELKDFADTAGLVSLLDLVITADTSVAHLAGAMGKPVWVMLPLTPDWRWMLNRTDSPWYPSMRLFRQSTRGDWETVMNNIARELNNSSVR